MLLGPLQYDEILFFVRYIQYLPQNSEIARISRNSSLRKIYVERLPIFLHQCVDTELLYLCAKFQNNPRRGIFFYLCPKLRCVRNVVRSRLLKKCKMLKRVCPVKHGKSRFIIWF